MNDSVIGMAAALGSAASWALGAVLFKQLGDRLPPASLTFAKGVAGLVMLGLVLAAVGVRSIEAWPLLLLTLSGLLGIAVGDTLFFIALRNLGAHAIVVLLTLGQVLTVLLALLWLGERPSAMKWLGIGLIVAGVAIVMWVRLSNEQTQSTVTGIVWGLAAVVCMSVSIIIAKEALESTGSLQAAFVRMLAGTLGIFAFAGLTRQLRSDLKPLLEPRFAGFFLVSVAVVTFGGFWLSLLAIDKVDVAVANTLSSTEPLFALPLAAFFLKEKITVPVVFGCLLAVAGIVMIVSPW